MSQDDRLVLVAKVAGAFGVRGEIRLSTFTDAPLAVVNYRDLLRKDGAPGLTMIAGRSTKGGIIARAKEVETKEQADRLRGLELFVPRSQLPPPDEEEYYLTDLIGLDVISPEGEMLGKVKAVQDFGAGDLIEVQPATGKSWYLPFTKELVPEVDLAGGRIIGVPVVVVE
jgi:16S rRNA processing protein RimM